MKDPFAVLGLPDTASFESVKEAYQRQLFKVHPDYGGNADSFRELRAAYLAASQYASSPKPCTTCEGRGTTTLIKGFHQAQVICPACKGAKHT